MARDYHLRWSLVKFGLGTVAPMLVSSALGCKRSAPNPNGASMLEAQDPSGQLRLFVSGNGQVQAAIASDLASVDGTVLLTRVVWGKANQVADCSEIHSSDAVESFPVTTSLSNETTIQVNGPRLDESVWALPFWNGESSSAKVDAAIFAALEDQDEDQPLVEACLVRTTDNRQTAPEEERDQQRTEVLVDDRPLDQDGLSLVESSDSGQPNTQTVVPSGPLVLATAELAIDAENFGELSAGEPERLDGSLALAPSSKSRTAYNSQCKAALGNIPTPNCFGGAVVFQ